MLIFGEEEVVVRKLGEGLVGAKVEDDAGTGGGEFLLEFLGEGRWLVEKFLVGGDDFHVADDDVSGVGGAVGQVDGGDLLSVFSDVLDVGVEVDGNIHFGHEFAEAIGEFIHSTPDIPETEVELDDGHEVHVAGGLESGGSDVFDEVFEDEPELGVGETFGDRVGHGGLVVDLASHEFEAVVADEFPEVIEAFVKVAFVDDFVLFAGVGEEFLEFLPVGFGVAGEFGELGFHAVVLLVKIQSGAVFKEVSPVRGDRVESDVVVHVFAGALEKVLEEVGEGEDGGAEVEGEAVLFKDIELAANAFVFFKDFDLVSGGAERDGGRESAETGTDDCNFRSFHCPPSSLGVFSCQQG